MRKFLRPIVAVAALSLTVLATQAAHAALGGNYQSVQNDSAVIKAQLRSTETNLYTVHELSNSSASVVREYVSSSGQVFAVTWQGFGMPDLKQLLGSYFTEYTTAAKAQQRPGMHRFSRVAQSDLVVQNFGRMRSFHGRAYVPSLVPSGVSVSDLP